MTAPQPFARYTAHHAFDLDGNAYLILLDARAPSDYQAFVGRLIYQTRLEVAPARGTGATLEEIELDDGETRLAPTPFAAGELFNSGPIADELRKGPSITSAEMLATAAGNALKRAFKALPNGGVTQLDIDKFRNASGRIQLICTSPQVMPAAGTPSKTSTAGTTAKSAAPKGRRRKSGGTGNNNIWL
ncbi:hypothetical protein CKO28_00160 [Rhodovibrio sodomensis]|uniref:Uncharacterized protein n=1 Tax=Rhodovibrio sodomensis TaxID=1088 RepID=A0ABS1D8K8_9PROT|nr:hypothetical protein [Rhodovibrio sodomensis]MBK1666452.1 hypothetical protein [Rhodovibrio sodomensis]